MKRGLEYGNSSNQINEDEETKIYVKVSKTVPMKVNGFDTIDDIKARFTNLEGVPFNIQRLFFSGDHLKSGYGMKIQIKASWNGKMITVDVNDWDIICDVKTKIQKIEGNTRQINLFYTGKELEDSRTLGSYNIQTGSTLYAVLCGEDLIQIYLVSPNRRNAQLEVKPWYTVGSVKTMIESLVGTPADQQKLVFAGTQMEDRRTLSHYQIQNGETIRMIPIVTFFIQKMWTGRRIELEMEMSDTVANVKQKIQETESIPENLLVLFLHGSKMEDWLDLNYYKIQKASILHLVIHCGDKMQIFVKNLLGKTITIDVLESDTIGSLQGMIEEKEGTPQDLQKLTFAGRLLVSDLTVAAYNIQHESTLYLGLRICDYNFFSQILQQLFPPH